MDLPSVFAERYERGEVIASRSSSQVYAATDTQTSARCVIKVYSDGTGGNQEWIDRFQVECEKLMQLSDPNLAKVLDCGYTGSHLFMVMQYVEGVTLRQLLKEHDGPLEAEQALSLAKQIAFGLETLRQAGVVHAHLDSRAVIVDGNSVKLAGFYPPVITVMRRSLTSAAGFIVDPSYISPEQVTGAAEPDFRSDLYSLGLLLFEMLTGKKPFVAGNAFQSAMMRVSEQPPSPSMLHAQINPILDAVVVKSLSKQPESRFQSFTDFIDAASAGTGGEVEENLDSTGESSSIPRMGCETIGVGISVEEIRKMLDQRDQSIEQNVKKAPVIQAGGSDLDGPTGKHSPQYPTIPETNAVPLAATVGPGEAKPGLAVSGGDQTLVGGIEVSELPASFMVVDGPRRGARFMLESGQTLIGSDASCNIPIIAKGVPARYALIVKKGNDYLLAPFAAGGVQINGDTLEGDGEHTLVRGDQIDVGPCKLRYVAPGEVFTLQDHVADRSIDRPKSKIAGTLKAVTALVAVLCVGLFFLFQQGISDRDAASKKQASSTAAKRKEVIAKLRQEGDALYREGKLIEPVGSNARTRFEQILELDPDDTYAKRRIDEIKERVNAMRSQRQQRERDQKRIDQLLLEAKAFYEKGDLVSPPGTNARESYQNVLRIDPQNEIALAGMNELNERLGTLLSQVNDLLAKAKQFRSEGKIIEPEGQNAHAMIKQVQNLNPGNADARNLLIDMAAESIYRGDKFKSKAEPEAMKKEYLKAQVLGADPEYLAPRLRGVDLMRRSTANVIIFDGDRQGAQVPKTTPEGYLDSSEIERRVAAWKLNDQVSGGRAADERFIELR